MTTIEAEHLLRPPEETDLTATKKSGSTLMRMTTVETEYLLRPTKEETDTQAFPKRRNNQRANDVRNRLAALKEEQKSGEAVDATTDQTQAAVVAPVS